MGITNQPIPSLADALFTQVQQRVLGILFGNPDRSYYANEIIRLAGVGTGAVQRELARLAAGGLVMVSRQGNQKHYQANLDSSIFAELHGLIIKTVGLASPLRNALMPIADDIQAAFVYGSVAKGGDTASSDIDLMIVSGVLTYSDVFGRLEEVTALLGRTVNPTIYTPDEVRKRIKQGNAFMMRVLEQPKLWIIGSENDLPT